MKDHKQIEEFLWESELTGPVKDLINCLKEKSKGMIDPRIEQRWGGLKIVGWRPFTETELAAAERRRAGAKKAAAKRKTKQREKDEADFARLAAKLGK